MRYALAFLVTFVIGGVTGVLLALPPINWLLHNTTFPVENFHNMLIPGALFGYLAGLNFWFPKAFGFRLDDTWGRRSFWCWVVGFYLAFMPLYGLGFLGMPRRMEHYEDPAWQPLLLVAAAGAVVVAFALIFQVVQLVVSIRHHERLRDETGDPWDGLTLEWLTRSPPPVYNFAVQPQVSGRDAFFMLKQAGSRAQPPAVFEDIAIPRAGAFGPFYGALAFAIGFAMVWHIWWLALVSLLAVAAGTIWLGSDDRPDPVISAHEIERIERQGADPLEVGA
jgi:cytochrome o ubiquinol oxidase subunit 1